MWAMLFIWSGVSESSIEISPPDPAAEESFVSVELTVRVWTKQAAASRQFKHQSNGLRLRLFFSPVTDSISTLPKSGVLGLLSIIT
jgi:hypothetical protein